MKILTNRQYNELQNTIEAQRRMRSDSELNYELRIQELEFKLEDIISKLLEVDNMLKQATAKKKVRQKVKAIIDFIKFNKEDKS